MKFIVRKAGAIPEYEIYIGEPVTDGKCVITTAKILNYKAREYIAAYVLLCDSGNINKQMGHVFSEEDAVPGSAEFIILEANLYKHLSSVGKE